ncbi:hypothetical protein GW796_00710 [archaeon]|nr:hypothetical protein [archaeon]NCQ50426.1 hypothetical protein [archaeon]
MATPKKSIKQSVIPSTLFNINYTSYSEETSEIDPEDDYSRASTSTTYSIHGISISEDSSFDSSGAFEVKDSELDKVYLVTAIYSTGDSFGNDEGYGIEFIEVFQSKDKAERCAKQIQANADLYNYLSNNYGKKDINKFNELISFTHNCPPVNKKGKLDSSHLSDVYYQNERNETKKFYSPWNGYFESLDSVSVEEFDLSLKKKTKYKL